MILDGSDMIFSCIYAVAKVIEASSYGAKCHSKTHCIVTIRSSQSILNRFRILGTELQGLKYVLMEL